MIETFGNALAEQLFDDDRGRAARSFPVALRRMARRKLLFLHDAADLRDLRVPPGNRLEKLKGKWDGFYSIRIDRQWRLVFQWRAGSAFNVQIVDYH